VIAGVIALAAVSVRAPADLVLTNALIWTGDSSRPSASALAVAGGRIAAVGSAADVAPFRGPKTMVLDGKGRRVVPGFIDGHTHFFTSGFDLLAVDLRDAKSPEEYARRLGDYARTVPAGRWLRGGTWDEQKWPGARLPDRRLLDRVTGDHPACLSRTDGHEVVCNSIAIRLAGVTLATPDPSGGVIVREASGEPAGVFKDAAQDLVTKVIPDDTPEEKAEALRAALAEAARVGVTSIHDITEWSDVPIYRAFRDRHELTVRVSSRLPIPGWEKARDLRATERKDPFWKIDGVKGFMDGSLGSATALMFAPFDDQPGNRGTFNGQWFPEGVMRDRILAADRAGLQVEVHAIGDRANAVLLDLYAETEAKNGARDRRFRIEHAQHLRSEDIPRFAKLGVIASMQPYHAIDDGRWAETRIGHERAKTSYAFRSLLDAGARVVFGSDWDVAPLSPLLGIYAASTRATLDGKHPGGWIPEQKVTVEEALRAYTTSAAYAEFAEGEKGRLATGCLGDFVVLSDDILSLPPGAIERAKVVTTVVGGRIVFGG
jgi:predicted amidohydrolase YtcJ